MFNFKRKPIKKQSLYKRKGILIGSIKIIDFIYIMSRVIPLFFYRGIFIKDIANYNKRVYNMKRRTRGIKLDGLWAEIATALVSVSVSYGVVTTKIKAMERELETFRRDHDLLVELNTKMDMLLEQKARK